MNRRSAGKRGHRLNVLIVGNSGCGKSTLVNTLCRGRNVANLSEWYDQNPEQAIVPKKLSLKTYTEDMFEDDIGHITLRIIEANGVNENLDSTQVIADLLRYIEGQFDEVLAEESRIKRNPRFLDNRVHAMIYMIEPTGHGLRELDIAIMLAVGHVVNVIPVISKADSLTPTELMTNKRLIAEDIEHYGISVFQFAGVDADENLESEESIEMQNLQNALPFAIVSSSKQVQLSGDHVALVREYPWGLLNVEDPKFSDFSTLRNVLLYSHINELSEMTTDYLYEQYRTQRLSTQPDFNAAQAAAQAPITASRANLNINQLPSNSSFQEVPTPLQIHNPRAGARVASNSSAFDSPYLAREDKLREEEEMLHKDERRAQNELEQRRQELKRRELELKQLEERLRQVPGSRSGSGASLPLSTNSALTGPTIPAAPVAPVAPVAPAAPAVPVVPVAPSVPVVPVVPVAPVAPTIPSGQAETSSVSATIQSDASNHTDSESSKQVNPSVSTTSLASHVSSGPTLPLNPKREETHS